MGPRSHFLCLQKYFTNVSPKEIPSLFFMLYALCFNPNFMHYALFFKPSSFSLKMLEQQVSEFFGEGANVFFDADRQKLYLAVWEKNDEAEKQLNNFLQQTYQFISISAVLRNVNVNEFYNDRKIDSAKVRRICRTILEGVQ